MQRRSEISLLHVAHRNSELSVCLWHCRDRQQHTGSHSIEAIFVPQGHDCILKDDVSSNLQEPWRVLICCFTEIRVWQVCVHTRKVWSVEEVVKLKPQLQRDCFCDGRLFQQSGIPLSKAGAAECAVPFIAFGAKCGWRRKVTGSEQSLKVVMPPSRIVVVHNVRKIEVVAVCVEIAASGRISSELAAAVRQWPEGGVCGYGKRIAVLNNGCAAQLPSAGNAAQETKPAVVSRKLIVPGQRKTVGRVPYRWPIPLMWIDIGGIDLRVIFGR